MLAVCYQQYLLNMLAWLGGPSLQGGGQEWRAPMDQVRTFVSAPPPPPPACCVPFQSAIHLRRDQFGLGQTRQLPGFPRLQMVGDDLARDWNLRITAATIEDEGMYQCQVLSSPASPPIRSSVARLVVVIPSGPPQILGSSPLVLVAGEEGQVSCEARGGRPAIQLEWEVGRVSVKDMSTRVEKIAGSVTYLTKTLLHIEPNWEDDGAEVKCKAFGQGGEPAGIASTTLIVQYKPQVRIAKKEA